MQSQHALSKQSRQRSAARLGARRCLERPSPHSSMRWRICLSDGRGGDEILDYAIAQGLFGRGPQELLEHLRADLTTYHKSVPAGTAKVNPAINARIGGFLRRLREALKRTRDARVRLSAR